MKTYIVLLRGVMPMGKNKVPMAQLREILIKTGLKNVRTYIQSGNVLVDTELSASQIEILVHDEIQKKIGGDLVVVACTHREIEAILKKNPFENTSNTKQLYYTIMKSLPDSEKLKAMLSIDFAPDKIKIINNVIYTCYATKLSDSKYNNNWYERKLKIAATTRNYNTMTRLLEMVEK